MPVIN